MKRPASKKNRWEDHYTRKAKKDKYPARSVYKLQEIQKKFRVIKKNDSVLDLGCAPGSWLIYVAELTGRTGSVAGIDLEPVICNLPAHVTVHTADMLAENNSFFNEKKQFNVVLSDMAPSTAGNKHLDNTRSFNLAMAALECAQKRLKPGGTFVCKIFQGEDFNFFLNLVRKNFHKINIFKPQSSRKASREIYIIGSDFLTKKDL
ncbi:23S rRNA (uridine2552-2'-O)-methyltransferase [Desulfosarcina sp. BuS5]|uniref:RlmE family RNA methyltransferase n=1 Tax=Desulfosarcina sp. BuS5 TaxID=933262 RepID=UPI0004849AF0|nr:RlmE family RNA methyltransferase [Desulfosarcina sp. BuS5]WDN89539.1 23S rRNA (uridine2552-2'-O)-methyltransferase [Desulfosarcina sp. BuS5]